MENHQCVVGVEAETRCPIDVHASETVNSQSPSQALIDGVTELFGVLKHSSWNQIYLGKGSRNLASQRSTLILVTYFDETFQVPNHRSVR